MAHELNIGTINGLTAEQILDKMVEKKIGIAGSGSGAGGSTVNVNPASLAVGDEFELGGTLWIAVHKTTTRVFAASKYLLGMMPFDVNKVNAAGTIYDSASTVYAASDIKEHARECAKMFSDAERAILCAHPDTGDLVSLMSYNELNGGFSYFNSNSRRICYDQSGGSAQAYWTRSQLSGNAVNCVQATGVLNTSYAPSPSHIDGFRPCIVLAL